MQSPETPTPTNILHLARYLAHRDDDGIPQLVFYDPGVGTQGNIATRVVHGITGKGIDENIMQLYTFLAMNYDEGDEIHMFGFSRGAYTVRSLAGMIWSAGLLGRDKLDWIFEAYGMYRMHSGDGKDAYRFRQQHNSFRVKIKSIVCFDTVGALGLPMEFPRPLRWVLNNEKHMFHDTRLSELIENAIHVLSIDEDRKGFLPTLMTANPKMGESQLTQLYFPGRHSGVGGGCGKEVAFSMNTLNFVVHELKRRNVGVKFDLDTMPRSLNQKLSMLETLKPFSLQNILRAVSGVKCRPIPSVDMLHESAMIRFARMQSWRPKALESIRSELETFNNKN